jgi:predicted dehydrogenase
LFNDRARDAKLILFETRAGSTPAEPAGEVEIVPLANREPLVLEALHFIEAVLDGRPVPSDGAEGLAVTSILEAGAASLEASGMPHRVAVATTGTASMDLQRLSHRSVPLPFDTLL